MPYTTHDDWSGDEGRHEYAVHFRLYVGRNAEPTVICVQDFDYLSYDARRILSPAVYATEAEAESALIGLLPAVGAAAARLSDLLDPDLRARMFASLVRDSIKAAQAAEGEA